MKSSIMRDAKRRSALVMGSLAVATAAWGTSNAPAFENFYCGVLINEGTWCGDGSNHSYNYNRATYGGTGNVWVCQRLLYADTSTEVQSPTCAYNLADHGYTPSAFLTEAEVEHNTGTNAQHTINGYATA